MADRQKFIDAKQMVYNLKVIIKPLAYKRVIQHFADLGVEFEEDDHIEREYVSDSRDGGWSVTTTHYLEAKW